MESLGLLICFGLAVTVHAAWVQLPLRGSSVGKFFVCGSLAGLLLVAQAIEQETLAALLAAVMAYAFICELYIFLFSFVGSSISARLLLKLRAGKLSAETIEQVNDGAAMVERRLQRLRAIGLLVQTNENVCVTEQGRRLVGAFRALHRFFAHAGSAPPEADHGPILRNVRPKHRLPVLTDSRTTGI